MPSFTTRFVRRALSAFRHWHSGLGNGVADRLRVQAVLAGAGIGLLVQALARAAEEAGEARFRLAMALVVVTAGSLSFVLYAQSRLPPRGRAGHLSDTRTCTSLLGCGLLAALQALQRLTG